MLPAALDAGIDYGEFFHLTPAAIRAVIEAKARRQKEAADKLQLQSWLTGYYVMHAIGVCFGKGKKYPKNPLEEVVVDNNMKLTEEEKIKYTRLMFGDLESMQKKFERSKQDGRA